TLKGVPASATSSPRMNTAGSRRSSSANASRIAWEKVMTRSLVVGECAVAPLATSGVDMQRHLAGIGERRSQGELHGGRGLLTYRSFDVGQCLFVHHAGCNESRPEQREGISFGTPLVLFALGAVVLTVDVADVVSVIAVGTSLDE